jgi:histidine triad (HIT) family protein
MSADCVFCKIVAGEIPSLRLFEDRHAVAFLDIAPLAPGHTLLIPRQHAARLTDLPPDELADVVRPLPRLARAILEASGAEGLNVLQNNGPAAGQVVEHFHIHLIPRRSGDGLGFRWNAARYGAGEAEEIAARVRRALEA